MDAALAARRNLAAQAGALGATADVTLLSETEVVSTRFWDGENVVLLAQAIIACERADRSRRIIDNA